MKLRYKIGLVVTILGIMFLWGRCSKTRTSVVPKIPATLPFNDVEQIRVNPDTHQLIITTVKGTKKVTLPDRTSTIDVLKNGSVKVTSPQIGLEHHLFIGLIGSDHLRIGVGEDIWYYKKLDLGLGIADQAGAYTPIAFAKITWNVKGNMQAGLIYGTDKYIGAIVSIRVF